jgi:post-segregation antitoxin (ccd killing protein)
MSSATLARRHAYIAECYQVPATKRRRGTTAAAGATGGDGRTVKVSVALPRRLWEEARAAVGDGSLSALVTTAVRRELAGRRTDGMLAELDEIYGPVPADVQ